jgi:signal transduction histidine kinase/DNA-binding response OmpR family regulator
MPRILVVDDDPHVARTLVDLLGFHGHDASRAESGEQALEMLGEHSFDLVILDVRLPGISGFETCLRIRETRGPSLPVIMLTALGDLASLRQGYEAGADDFLQKPVDTPALILKVRAFLRLKSLHDEIVGHREEAVTRAKDLALLHDIGRDWSLIASPEEFNRMVTQRLATLIGAPICLIALYDTQRREMVASLPAHGLPDDVARRIRYGIKPEHTTLWNLRSGRPYVSNRARSDLRLLPEIVEAADAESVVLMPMLSEGAVLGLLVAVNKPGGFTDNDVQLLSIFAGPAASFIRSRQIFDRERVHAARLERVAALAGEMSATLNRTALVDLVTTRLQRDLGFQRVAFWTAGEAGALELAAQAEPGRVAVEDPAPAPPDLLGWALRSARPLQSGEESPLSELAVPVKAGETPLGVLALQRADATAFGDEEVNLLAAVAGHMAAALQKADSVAHTERLAGQMATLYDLGLETGAMRDLRALFGKATQEAGRIIRADYASVLRMDADNVLQIFAAWAREPHRETFGNPRFRLGEGIAGRVARDRVPAIVNDVEQRPEFVSGSHPMARLMVVPLLYYDQERRDTVLFGVLNASRRAGAPPFNSEDLEYLTRFAGQLSIAVANSTALAAERERSEQLALVNTLLREIAGSLSRERVLETAVRRIQEAFDYPVVAISVPDFEQGTYRIAAVVTQERWREEWRSFPIHSGITGRAYRDKRTINVTDVTEDPDYIGLVSTTRSEVVIPVFSGEDVAAVLNVEKETRGGFDRGQVITLETLADGIGVVLRNAELYQALEATNAKLVELDRMKSELVNIVAHDFRAPLAGVLGHAELLEWRPDAPSEERVEQARAIIHAATHMANLVDKTLKTTRLETGHFPFDFGLVEVGTVVREVVERFPQDERHPLVLDLPEDPVPAWADLDRVSEVLDNLLSNAVKYSPDGGEIHIELRREADSATLTVRDRGIGIAARDLGRLFRPFSRVRDRRTADIEGSGLGLYICERIVRAHGGRLWVDTEPGQGSAFAFTIPLYGAGEQLRAPLVLIATGDERTRREVRRVAEELGFATHDVSDGVEAVEAAMRLIPAAVVLDRILPKLGAREVAERLRENTATEGVPLFALADRAELDDPTGLFSGYVSKPLDPETLAAALGAVSKGA